MLSISLCTSVFLSAPADAQTLPSERASNALQLYDFDIPAGTASKVLNQIALQTRHPLLFNFDQVGHIPVNQVSGSLTLEKALQTALEGTALQSEINLAHIISISTRDTQIQQTTLGDKNMKSTLPKKAAIGGASALLLASTALPAVAQDNAFALEDIIVTAQKRSQSSQDVPITVEAVSGADLTAKGIDNLFDLATIVPGVVFSRAPDDGLALTVRGLGTAARTQSFDQSVALFLDGMFVGKGRMYSGAFFDVDRVEVIKGTQSTLLGKNTSLGAISLVTRKPGEEFSADVTAGVDLTYGGYTLDGGVDIPVSDDFQLRAAAHIVDREGWVENLATGGNSPRDKELAGRITGVFTPADNLTLTAMYQHSDFEREGNAFQFVSDDPLPDALIDVFGEFDLNDTKTSFSERAPGGESFHSTVVDSLSLTVDVDAMGHTFTSQTSTATYDLDFVDDFDFGVLPAIGDNETPSTDFARTEGYDQFSQEFRVASPTGQTLEYLAGIFYFSSEWDSVETQIFETPFNPPEDPPVVEIFNGTFANNFTQETETLSVFGSATYNVNDDLRIIGGLRYTDETKEHTFGRDQIIETFWTTVENPPFAETALPFEDDFLNGNLAVQYNVTPDVMLYGSYGVGTKTGGFAESAAVPTGDPLNEASVRSETATSYELGVKSTIFDGAARLNAALFLTEVDDFQETSFSGASFDTINSQVSAPGAEASLYWRLSDALTLDTALTYVDAKVDAGTFAIGSGTVSYPERSPAQAPEFTGHLGLIAEAQMDDNYALSGSAYLRHRSDMVHQYVDTFRSDDLTTLDASIGVDWLNSGVSFKLIGTNLTDEVSVDFSGPPAAAGTVPPGVRADSVVRLRTVMAQLSKKF